jgi:shikimate dehydrogenase
MEKLKLGLIGYPLGHSLSPILYQAAFKDLGIEGEYELLETAPEDLINQIKNLKRNKYFGFNVTIPHKVPLTLFLSKYDEYVNMTGSVNTVKIEEDLTLSGYNTDVYGFCEAIPKNIDLKGNLVMEHFSGDVQSILIVLLRFGLNQTGKNALIAVHC